MAERSFLLGVIQVTKRFLELYDLYFDDVYRYVYLKTGNKWDSDDIVSDVFRKVFQSIKKCPNTGNSKAWLFLIARNTVIDYYRKKREVTVGDDVERFTPSVPFKDPLEGIDDLACLKHSILHLDTEEKEIINLHYFSGLKYKEIGDLLAKSESSIKMKASRIIKKIAADVKQCLEGSNHG